MASAAFPLLEEMKRTFYPFATARGFLKQKSEAPGFTVFRRVREQRIEAFKVQWDKYCRPFFVINFGRGVADSDQHQASGRLQRRRGGNLSCWFNIRRPWSAKLRSGKWNYQPAEVVSEVIAAFPELEAWWATGEAGPHIYISQLHA